MSFLVSAFFSFFELTETLTSFWRKLGCFDNVQKTKTPANQGLAGV